MSLNIENQVVSLALSKELKKFGLLQESLFYWEILKSQKDFITQHPSIDNEYYSAYTISELIDLFPFFIKSSEKEYRLFMFELLIMNGWN